MRRKAFSVFCRVIEAAECLPLCAVCVEPLKVGHRLSRLLCGHMFHAQCLLTWLEQASSCPTCRYKLQAMPVTK